MKCLTPDGVKVVDHVGCDVFEVDLSLIRLGLQVLVEIKQRNDDGKCIYSSLLHTLEKELDEGQNIDLLSSVPVCS